MKSKFYLLLLLFSLSFFGLKSQIQLNSPDAAHGYVLLTLGSKIVLVDNCGDAVHTWQYPGRNIWLHAKLYPDGNLVFIENSEIVVLSWDNQILLKAPADGVRFNYEVIKLPSGNFLTLARKPFSIDEFKNVGFSRGYGELDIVQEISSTTGEVVWEWSSADHVIQERDSTKANYGSVAENPQLLNVDAISDYDWTQGESFMFNGMDYNLELDQIVLSVRKMSEFIIIDHSTTTAEAAGSTGGNQGKGGDILYRWGNPQNYGRGTADDRQLYFQHNPHWITEGDRKGKIMVFNNGLNRDVPTMDDLYSSIEIVDPPIDASGGYLIEKDSAFLPEETIVSFNKLNFPNLEFYSGYLSGAQVLPNENIFVTSGIEGECFEITSTGEVVWEYQFNSGDGFRAVKYPFDYPAFVGKDLIPTGAAELPNPNYDCNLFSSTNEAQSDFENDLKFMYQVDNQQIMIENFSNKKLKGQLLNMQGIALLSETLPAGTSQIPLNSLPSGMYFYRVFNFEKSQNTTYKFFKL